MNEVIGRGMLCSAAGAIALPKCRLSRGDWIRTSEPPAPRAGALTRLSYAPNLRSVAESNQRLRSKSVHACSRARKYVSLVDTVRTQRFERQVRFFSWLLLDFLWRPISLGSAPTCGAQKA